MASREFDLLLLMKKSPLKNLEWGLGKNVSTTLRANKITCIAMHWVGSGVEQQWHCFWPVDEFDSMKPVVFVEVYRQLNSLMSDNRGVLNPIVGNKNWDKVEFPMRVGDVDRRFACGSLLVLARTFLQPKYSAMPTPFLDSLKELLAAERDSSIPLPPTNPIQQSWSEKTNSRREAAKKPRESN